MTITELFERNIFLLENGYISMFLTNVYYWRNRFQYNTYSSWIIYRRLDRIIEHALNHEYDIVYQMLREWQTEHINYADLNSIEISRYGDWKSKNQLSIL